MRLMKYFLLMAAIWLCGASQAEAQNDRAFIREGNRAFKAQKWAAAETQYRKAISKNGKNPQAIYNLGCALLMQQKDSAAMIQYEQAAKLEPNKLRRAKSYHNMGVVMQHHQDYAQAIAYYKDALRCNPQDNETRYNLALCKKLLKNQQQNKQNQNKDKNKDKNKQDQNKNDKDKNKDQNKDQNKDKDKQDKNKNDKNKNNNNNNQQNKPDQNKMSRDNAEQLLNAAIQQEKTTKQKLQKAMSQPRRKAYDKNW